MVGLSPVHHYPPLPGTPRTLSQKTHSPTLSLAKSPRLSRCKGKSTPTELFLIEPREAENRLRSELLLRKVRGLGVVVVRCLRS